MKISIITVCYNSSRYIASAMESVLAQTYSDIEYIVVDGGSTDGTVDIIRDFEPRFGGRMRWVSERDNGIYDAMNKGVAMATGDVAGILNSDDFFTDSGVVSDIVSGFSHSGVDVLFGNLYMVDAEHTERVVRVWRGSPFVRGSFARGWHPAHPTFYVRRWVYERYGCFDTSFAVSADFELMLRFMERGDVAAAYLDRFIVTMRLGGESTGSVKRILKGNRNILRAFAKNGIRVNGFFYTGRRFCGKLMQYVKK